MTYYVCSLPHQGEPGEPKELFTDDLDLAERFIEGEDKRPGRGVYQCINPLVPGARRRSLETVARLQFIYFDLDLQNIETSRDEVIKRLQKLPVEFIWVRDSGSGNLHVGIEIKDAPVRDTPEYDRVVAVWKRLAEKLAADPAPVHPAALIRCVGTHNKKNSGNGLCHMLWNGGGPLDITELEELDDLLTEPLLARKPRPAGGAGEPHTETGEHTGPVDVEAEFATIHDGASANAAQKRVIPSLLRKGEHPGDVLQLVVDNTLAMAERHALPWTREAEVKAVVKRILSGYSNLLMKDYDPTTGVIPSWLPGEFHQRWVEVLEAGRRPDIGYNRGGFYVRSYGPKDATDSDARRAQDARKPQKPSANERRALVLRPFVPFDVAKLPPRSWLYGKHYQRCTVSLTAGPGGMGKSSLDMVEAIAMATCRNLLGEQPEERTMCVNLLPAIAWCIPKPMANGLERRRTGCTTTADTRRCSSRDNRAEANMTLDEALQLAAQKLDQAFVERVESNYAAMVAYGLSDSEIADFQKLQADNFPAIRNDALAKLRERLQLVCLQRGAETFQQRWNSKA